MFNVAILYANKMVCEGGYVTPNDIYGAYISSSVDEDYNEATHSSYCEKHVFFYELSGTDCADVLNKINDKGIEHIFVLGDDASIIFDSYLKQINLDIKWVSVLASSQFNRNVPKFWISQSLEVSLLVNKLRHFDRISTISSSEHSEFTKNLKQNIDNALSQRYDKEISLDYRKSDVVFIAGLGDKKHIELIQDCIKEGKLVFSNNAILDCAEKLKGIVWCLDLYYGNRFNIKLQSFYLQLAFELVLFPLHDNLLTDVLYSDVLKYPIHFDKDGYLSLPLCMANAQFWRDEYNYYLRPELINSDSTWDIYNVSKTIAKIQKSQIDYQLKRKVSSISYMVYHKGTTNRYVYFSDIPQNELSKFDTLTDKILLKTLSNSVFTPVQINLEEEDPVDNDTMRLYIDINDVLRYPIVIPSSHVKAKICVSDSLNGEIRYDINASLEDIKSGNGISYIYIIPYLKSSIENNIYSCALITTNRRLNYIDLKLLDSFIQPQLIEKHRNLLAVDINREAIKSAKAAIMSRNMSHNLGSHVMAYLKQHLGSVKDMLDKKVLYSLVPEILDKQVDLKNIAETTEMPFLIGLGRFIGYLQERQDYIATVATDYIPYIAPVNLKDAIYDELNPDLRYARHNDTDDKNRPSNILLKYIAKSEGLSREEYNPNETNDHDIRIGFKGYKDGAPLKTTFGESSVDESMTVLRQINLGLPGGLIGRQAIFSIIENIIRNAAKHGVFDGQDKSLELIIDVIDGRDVQRSKHDVFKDRIFDEEIFNLLKDSTDIKNLQVITITDNLKTTAKVIDNLRRALNEDYLDESGKMQNANKGMKEMRISAAWLRHYTDEESYSKMSFTDEQGVLHEAEYGLKAPLFACEQTKDGNLRYLFCVSKCRKAIIVKDDFAHDAVYGILEQMTTNKSDWKNCSKDELLKNDFDKSAEFILVGDEGVYKQIRPLLSNRVVKLWTITDSQKQMILTSNEDAREETLLRVIYQLYSGMTSADTRICIIDSSPGYQSYFEGIEIWDSERNAESAKYVYRKHHATENDFMQYWRKRFRHESFTAAQCVEGITGNNSSDRLVRREPLDEKWYYLHLNAMKRRIAILDERIFNNEHKVDDKQFFTGDTALLNFMEKNRIFLQSCPLQDAISKVNDELSDILPADCLDDIYYVDSNEELITLIDQFAYKEQNQSADNYRSIYQHERGVDIFTILKTRYGWGIYGCCKYGIDEDCLCEYGKIAEISLDGDDFMISTCGESVVNYKSRYEYISIHQGLLDKLYEGFNCKNDYLGKLKLTRCLYEFFGSGSPIGEYLPNFIIHSGRSKPTEYDMPQKQPFVQYAAIENGVKDCKYSLVELLDYARYE